MRRAVKGCARRERDAEPGAALGVEGATTSFKQQVATAGNGRRSEDTPTDAGLMATGGGRPAHDGRPVREAYRMCGVHLIEGDLPVGSDLFDTKVVYIRRGEQRKARMLVYVHYTK